MNDKKRRTRYFWFLSDQKTIREIEYEQYRRLVHKNYRYHNKGATYSHTLVRLSENDCYLWQGIRMNWCSRTQLEAALNED